MTASNHIIWSDYNLNYDDWREDLEAEYPDYTDEQREDLMYRLNDEAIYDERANLNIQLSRPILVIADLGLWDGRKSGYKEIASGNIKDCLYSENDYNTWFVDKNGDLCCDSVHHDGTNHYLYRVYKPGVTRIQIDKLKEKLYDGTATRADITRITQRLGDEIAKVYGWQLTRERNRGEAR